MTSDSRFLRLPRELRDRIYSFYVFESNGYCLNPHTGKLRVGGEPGHRINHALRYTCTTVAAELRGVGLRENTIHFRPFQDDGTKACRFESLLRAQDFSLNLMLECLADLVSPDILETLREKYPDNDTLKELIKDTNRSKIVHLPMTPLDSDFTGYDPWIGPTTGEAPSLNRAIVQDMLQLALSKPSSSAVVSEVMFGDVFIRQWEESNRRVYDRSRIFPFYQDTYREMLRWSPPMWKVPTSTDLNQADTLLQRDTQGEGRGGSIYWYWSACSSAIKFLAALEPNLRSFLRHIIIHEDRNCVAYPETHAQGLIPFAQENPRLIIEQHVDINHVIVAPRGSGLALWSGIIPASPGGTHILESLCFMSLWITEVTALRNYGMPEKAFSLTFHGLPSLQQKLWDRLKRMAMIQEAMSELSKRGIPNHLRWAGTNENPKYQPVNENSLLFLARPKFHVADGFSDAIRDMASSTPCIRLPAAIKGEPWDTDDVVRDILADHQVMTQDGYDDLFHDDEIDDDDLGTWYDNLRDFYWDGTEAELGEDDD